MREIFNTDNTGLSKKIENEIQLYPKIYIKKSITDFRCYIILEISLKSKFVICYQISRHVIFSFASLSQERYRKIVKT